jgi:hypothetical protein
MNRMILAQRFAPVLAQSASQTVDLWEKTEAIEQLLQQHFDHLPQCNQLYIADRHGKQISASISKTQVDRYFQGKFLSSRPYADMLYPKRHLALSSIYQHDKTSKPCLTALQPIWDRQRFLGFLAADFDA